MNEDIPGLENNRKILAEIWRKYKNNEELNAEEGNIAGLMALHKDWFHYWESPETFDNPDLNPYLHIAFDTIIMNQVDNNEPAQARFTYNKLTSRGVSHLETIHKMALVLTEEIFISGKSGKPLNVRRYSQKLKELK
jgi:hypothetical protein